MRSTTSSRRDAGGVERRGVRRGLVDRAVGGGVPRVASLERVEHLRLVGAQLGGAAAGALLRRGGEEDLDLGVGRDHRADVAALGDPVAVLDDGLLLARPARRARRGRRRPWRRRPTPRGSRIAEVTSRPSSSTLSPTSMSIASATAAGSSPRSAVASATARYIAPVSRYVKPSRCATARATVDFPAPAGPSMAMTMGMRLALRDVGASPLATVALAAPALPMAARRCSRTGRCGSSRPLPGRRRGRAGSRSAAGAAGAAPRSAATGGAPASRRTTRGPTRSTAAGATSARTTERQRGRPGRRLRGRRTCARARRRVRERASAAPQRAVVPRDHRRHAGRRPACIKAPRASRRSGRRPRPRRSTGGTVYWTDGGRRGRRVLPGVGGGESRMLEPVQRAPPPRAVHHRARHDGGGVAAHPGRAARRAAVRLPRPLVAPHRGSDGRAADRRRPLAARRRTRRDRLKSRPGGDARRRPPGDAAARRHRGLARRRAAARWPRRAPTRWSCRRGASRAGLRRRTIYWTEGGAPRAAPRTQRGGEVGLEARVGDGGRLHPVDLDALARREAGDGAEHGQAVVAVGGDDAAAQAARALDDEAVVGRLDLGAEAAQPVDDGRDPVGLLERAARRRRARRSPPPRSSRPAPPAAARRSPAGPRRRRPSCRRAGRRRRRAR